jgi:hypothetical protein
VKPLSFRVFSTGDNPRIVRVIDFEIGRVGGESLTAALGESAPGAHINFGILPVDSSYSTIREKAITLIRGLEGGKE